MSSSRVQVKQNIYSPFSCKKMTCFLAPSGWSCRDWPWSSGTTKNDSGVHIGTFSRFEFQSPLLSKHTQPERGANGM